MKTLLTLLLAIGLVTAVPSSPLRADTEEVAEIEEKQQTDIEAEHEYLEYLENQKRLQANLGFGLGPLGFKLGGGLGPGQTGAGAALQLGPLGFKLGGGLGLQQSGLGAGLQLGSLGVGASTGFSNGGLGLNANAGFGNNYLGYGNQYYSKYRENPEEKEDEEVEDYNNELEEAYQDLVESQKRFLKLHAAANLGSIGGFNVGGGLGPGQTGFGAGAFLGPLGVKLGGGLGLQQGGLGGGVQLGSLGLGASTGYSNGHLGFGGNAGFGNNFLGHGTKYTPAPYVYARNIDPQARHVCTYARHLCTYGRQLPLVPSGARPYYGPY